MNIEYRKAEISDVDELTKLRVQFLCESGNEPDDTYDI